MIFRSRYTFFFKTRAAARCFFIRLFFYKRLFISSIGLFGHAVYIRIAKNGKITIGNRPIVSDYVELQALGEIVIGNNLTINRFSRICAHEKILIGNNVTVAQFVTILDHDHHCNFEDNKLSLRGYDSSPISIGNNVWIGDKVTILKGVSIGNNVIIAANSVVTKAVMDNCIVGGIPAKLIKTING